MNFEETVSFRLTKAGNSHRYLLERKMREIGLHSGQVFLLFELWKKDGQRQIDLATRLKLSPPTVNKVLGGLIQADLVTRERYEDDARSTRIFLTKKGQEIRAAVEEQWADLEAEMLAQLTETESLMLSHLLVKMFASPEEIDM